MQSIAVSSKIIYLNTNCLPLNIVRATAMRAGVIPYWLNANGTCCLFSAVSGNSRLQPSCSSVNDINGWSLSSLSESLWPYAVRSHRTVNAHNAPNKMTLIVVMPKTSSYFTSVDDDHCLRNVNNRCIYTTSWMKICNLSNIVNICSNFHLIIWIKFEFKFSFRRFIEKKHSNRNDFD